MSGTEIIELLANSNITWAAAFAVMAIALRPVLGTLMTGLVETRRAQAKAVEERNVNEKEQTRVLAGVQTALNDNATLTRSVLNLIQPISQIPNSIEEASKRMSARADARDSMLAVHNQRLEQLHQAVMNIPTDYMVKSAQHFDPQFTSLQMVLSELKRQIETTQDILTPGVVKEIRAELVRINRRLETLSDINFKKLETKNTEEDTGSK